MSDEFETISVVETEPVEVASAEPVMADAPVPAPASEPVSEQPDADQRVFDNNPKIGSSEDNIKQDVAAENGTALDNGGSEGRAPVTARGREEAENKKQEARADLIEQMAQAEARRDFLNKDHDFGGMKMSGADLNKLMEFYAANPDMLGKLTARLSKNNDPEKVKKGVKEFQEFLDLKKKEQEGKLDAEGQHRLEELKKSEEFKLVAQAAVQQAKDNGINLTVSKSIEAVNAQTNIDMKLASASGNKLIKADISTQVSKTQNLNGIEGFDGMELARTKLTSATMASADGFDTNESPKVQMDSAKNRGFESTDLKASREKFASAPHLTSEFSTTVAAIKPAAANDPSFEDHTAPAATVVAQAQLPKKVVTADVSFG